MKNPILRYGLIGALVVVFFTTVPWLTFSKSMSYSLAVKLGYLSVLLALSSIFFAVRQYRDDIANGMISFWKAFKIGILTTLIPSAFMFVSTAIFHMNYGEEFRAWSVDAMKKSLPEEQFQAQMESMGDLVSNPYFQGAVMFITVFVIGVIVSIIVALIMKTKTPEVS